jgi:Ca-activated chloride channel family protein
MTFAWPLLLWLLLAPVGLLVWDLTHRRRTAGLSRPKILRAEAGTDSLRLSSSASQPTGSDRTGQRPRFWLFAGLALAIVALARPQYGRLEEPIFDQSREILLAIDLSRSMLSPDVKPTRLERAKLLIQSLLEKLEGERVGLVVFSGTAFLQSPLSADYEILREFLPALGPEFLPEGGTNYRALLDASLQAFGNSNAADRFLVILSDGEATDDDWKSRIEELKKKNIRVLGLGVGTSAGAMIPDGTGGFIKDERGAVVLSKLESATLQELATATSGVYRDASGWLDLAGLVKETVEAGRKGQFLEKNTVRLAERFQWPLALGLWCLLVSLYAEFPVRPRPRDIKLTTTPKIPAPTAAVKIAAALLVLLGLVTTSRPSLLAITPPGSPPSVTPPAAAAPPPSAALAKIIGRLSASDSRTARDWAELGRETATWGSRLQSEQQPIPEGPVRDALAAVDAGSALDPKTADWPKLRSELEALLKKSDEQKQDQQKQDEKDQKDQKDQQDKNQQEKDQKNQDQKKSDQQQQDKDQKNSQQQKQDQSKQQEQPKPSDEEQKQGESAFGDMKKNEPPPPPPDPGTQKVGGAPEKKEAPQQPADPALALPLQKLEQLRNQDSPAHLFQLMEGERKPTTKTKGKDW